MSWFLSLFLAIWGIWVYRITIVQPRTLMVVFLVGTILGLFFLRKQKKVNGLFVLLFLAFSIGGGTSYFLFLAANRFLADKTNPTNEILAIERTGTFSRGRSNHCRDPFAIVDFHGFKKQLVFSCQYEKTIDEYKQVQLSYVDGFLGYPIVLTKELMK